MKTTKIVSLLLVTVLICGCKNENWSDWKAQNEVWLAQNALCDSIVTTPTGLQYKCIDAGWEYSAQPDEQKMVVITYTGQLINGYVFDSTFDKTTQKDNPASMYVSEVVQGFAEGLKKMHQYGHFKFYIPYKLGYGANGSGSEGTERFIPPYSTLIFDVTLHSVN